MSTSSTSNSTTVQQQGGSLGTAGSVSIFKDSDYPGTGLASKEALKRFFTQLNPMMKTLQGFSDGSVGLANLDADYLSVPVNGFQSDWNSLVSAASGVVTGPSAVGVTITTFDGQKAWIAYRKDAWGRVDVWFSVAISGAGSPVPTLPTAYCPPITAAFATPAATAPSLSISASGGITFSASAPSTFSTVVSYPCATLSPGFTPGAFPVYLKIAQGKTPVACFLAGAKPQTSQDLSQVATGTLGLPLACAWTFMGASTPAADGSKINQIRIDSIPGLVTNQNYILNFLVFYGQTGSSSGA